jgi:hypothetical protein
MKNFSTNPNLVGAGGRLIESYSSHAVDIWRAIRMRQEWGENKSTHIPFLFGSNNVFKKDILIKLGGYNQECRTNYEDVDICRRIKEAGYTFVYEPKAVAYHIKGDTLFSLLDNFWWWNFNFYKEKGFYEDYRGVRRKIRENIGIANRFMEEDLAEKRYHLLYIDFLLPVYLFLQDFNFVCNDFSKQRYGLSVPSYISYLNLIDLIFFYLLDNRKRKLRSMVSKKNKFLQNFLVFSILIGRSIKNKFNDTNFLKPILEYFLRSFLREGFLEDFQEKIVRLINVDNKWDIFLKKKHPYLEKTILKNFVKEFERWLDVLSYRVSEIFDLIKVSQRRLIKKEVEL